MPGFVVVSPGMAAPDVCLGGYGSKARNRRPEKSNEVFSRAQRETLRWLKDSLMEEQRARMEDLREDLGDAWEQMEDHGSKAQKEYQKWIAECLHEPPSGRVRTRAILRPDQWSEANKEFRHKSRWVHKLNKSIDSFNEISGYYCELRRHSTAVHRGYSSSVSGNQVGGYAGTGGQDTEDRFKEEYDPSDKVVNILNALMDIIQDWDEADEYDGLDAYSNRAEVWKEVYRKIGNGDLEGTKAAKDISEPLRSHLKDNGFGNKFPKTVKEVEKLVRELC